MLERPESIASSSFDDAWKSIVEANESSFADERLQKRLDEAKVRYVELMEIAGPNEVHEVVNQLNTLIADYIGYEISASGLVYEVSDGRVSSEPKAADELLLRLYGFTVVTNTDTGDDLRLLAEYEGGEPRSYTVPLANQILPEAQFSASYVEAILQSYVPEALSAFDEIIMCEDVTMADILMAMKEIPMIELDILHPEKAASVAAKFSLYMHRVLQLDRGSDQLMAYGGRVMLGGVEGAMHAASCLISIEGIGPVYVQTEGAQSEGVWKMAFMGTIRHVDFAEPLQDATLFVDAIQSSREIRID